MANWDKRGQPKHLLQTEMRICEEAAEFSPSRTACNSLQSQSCSQRGVNPAPIFSAAAVLGSTWNLAGLRAALQGSEAF